jgi:hypothetical protein
MLPESTKSSMFGKGVDLSMSPEWAQFDGEDLLWIPGEHRADDERSDARENTAALGQEDGSLMILTFDPLQL